MSMKIMISDICEAFKSKAVGSKVKKEYRDSFMKELRKAIRQHDFSKDRVPGQAVITLSKKVNNWVSPGSARRGSTNPKDFVLRKWRGEVGMYMKRNPLFASAYVRCVVYTRDAYLNDPDCDVKEREKVYNFLRGFYLPDYVLVAVLGDPDVCISTVSYSRFVKNLAGANNEYKVMSKADLVALAKKVDAYRSMYMVVAD